MLVSEKLLEPIARISKKHIRNLVSENDKNHDQEKKIFNKRE